MEPCLDRLSQYHFKEITRELTQVTVGGIEQRNLKVGMKAYCKFQKTNESEGLKGKNLFITLKLNDINNQSNSK